VLQAVIDSVRLWLRVNESLKERQGCSSRPDAALHGCLSSGPEGEGLWRRMAER
jgi:hypothetical protein